MSQFIGPPMGQLSVGQGWGQNSCVIKSEYLHTQQSHRFHGCSGLFTMNVFQCFTPLNAHAYGQPRFFISHKDDMRTCILLCLAGVGIGWGSGQFRPLPLEAMCAPGVKRFWIFLVFKKKRFCPCVLQASNVFLNFWVFKKKRFCT